jgi:hypothetical protein
MADLHRYEIASAFLLAMTWLFLTNISNLSSSSEHQQRRSFRLLYKLSMQRSYSINILCRRFFNVFEITDSQQGAYQHQYRS